MSQTQREIDEQKVVEAAVASVLRFNEKQEYVDDDRTYPEHYIKNKSNILRSAGVSKDFNDSDIDQILAMREINDVIEKQNPELKRLIEKGTLSIDYGDVYPSAYINTADIENELVFSLEPADDINEGKIGLGAKIYIWSDNEGLIQSDLKEGINQLQSTVESRIYQVALEKEFNGELEENQAYKHLLDQGDLTVKSVEIKSAEFSKFPGGMDEDNFVKGIIKYQIDGRNIESEFRQNISGGDYFKETVYDNIGMLRIDFAKGVEFIDVETGEKDKSQRWYPSGKIKVGLAESINETLKRAEPVLTANYNKPNPKLVDSVDATDGKHYSFKPETLDALAKFGQALVQAENKKRNKLKM